jgi:hypothetical protein
MKTRTEVFVGYAMDSALKAMSQGTAQTQRSVCELLRAVPPPTIFGSVYSDRVSGHFP